MRCQPTAAFLPRHAGGGGARRLFLDKGLRVGGGRRQADLVALYFRDQPGRDEVVVAGVASFRAFDLGAAVLLGQLDPVALDLVDRADMDAVGADHFHMFANIAGIGHGRAPSGGKMMQAERPSSQSDAPCRRAARITPFHSQGATP